MAMYHEVKEVTQLEEGLLTFQLTPYTDDLFRTQPLTLQPVPVTAGVSPFDPTFRLTVKAKEDDLDAYALFQKTIPPYPDNLARMGVFVAGTTQVISGGIKYINGQPWWYWYKWAWPSGYTYSPTTPPTTGGNLWDPLQGGIPFYAQAFDNFQGEVSFSLGRYDSWFPPGNYFGWLEVWKTGAGTPPAGPPALVLQCQIRINKTSRRNPIF